MSSKKLKYYCYTAFANIILQFSTGAIIQSFLSSKGLDNGQIGIFTLLISVMQVVTLFLSTFFSDRIINIPKTIAKFILPSLIFFSAMVYISTSKSMNVNTIFIISILVTCILNFFYGLRVVLEYKLPYYIIDISEYALLSNTSGIILSILGFAVTGLFLFFSTKFDYSNVITISFIISAGFAICASLIVFSFGNETNPTPNDGKKETNLFYKELFKMREVHVLSVPNFIRGIATGIMGMAAVVMLSSVTNDASLSSGLSAASSVGYIISCFIYTRIYKKFKTLLFTLFGASVEFIALLFILSNGSNVKIFVIFYIIAYIGQVFVDVSIPVYITEIIPYKYMGGFTSIRMLLFTAGTATGNYIAGVMSASHPKSLMILCGCAQLIAGIWYYIFSCNDKNYQKR